MRAPFRLLTAAGLAWALSACTASGQPTPTTVPGTRPSAPTRLLPSPTPTLPAAIDGLVLRPGQPPYTWTAIGLLTNQGDRPVQGLDLRVSLMDSQDRILERSDATLAIPILGPGASAPFSAMFRAEGGTQVSAKISGYRPADRQPLPIDVALNRRTSSGDGQLAVVGTMTNPNSSPVKLIGFTLAASDPDHVLLSLNSNWFGLVGLAAGQTAPFLALLPSSDDLTHLQSYAAAEPAADLPQIAIDLPVQPVLQTDDQGNPIVLAVVHNHGKAPSMVRILITLTGPLGPASAALYASPIPLAPDEQRPFSLTEFPGLAHQLASGDQNLSELQPEALIDPSGSSPASQEAVPLEIEITTYEAIGGTILVHGTAYNQSQARVLQPTVIGALRSTSGDIWSAGEASLGQELASDSQVAFLLVMPRPARIEPSEGEFDVRGLGLVP